MVIIGTQQEIENYFESEDINQSTLKNLIPGFDNFMMKLNKEESSDKDYFLIGGAVDTILTGEEGDFENQYYTSTLEKKPSEVEMNIIKSVFDELVDNNVIDIVDFEDSYDAILAAANEFSWQMRWKSETRVSKLIEAGRDYFEDLKRALGKKIITSEMRARIDSIVTSLKSNPRTSKYFDRDLQKQQDNISFYYQLPIYFEYEGLNCKALMDLVVVHDDGNGNITKIEPYDLKTMSGNTLSFVSKVKQHRYDIQAAWYNIALMKHFNVERNKIEPFRFIVESTTNIGNPLVYQLSVDTLIHGRKGTEASSFKAESTERRLYYPEVKGIDSLIKDYKYYQEQGWVKDRILDNNPREIIIDWTKGII